MSSEYRIGYVRAWRDSTRSSSARASTPSRARHCSRKRAGASACSSATTSSAAASGPRPTSRFPASRTRCSRPGIRSSPARPAYAELKPDLDRRGLEYLNTELPTGVRLPGRLRAPSSRPRSRTTSPSSRATHRRTARPGRPCSTGSWPTRTSRSACSGPSSGRPRGSGSDARRFVASAVAACSSTSAAFSRAAATGSATRSSPRRRTACSRRGCSTPGSAPTRPTSGFMTQVIACALQLGGMPVPKGGGDRARRRARRDRPRRRRRGAHRRGGRARARLRWEGDGRSA